jgi:hypothetical protein
MKTVILEQAFVWQCPTCGKKNFEEGESTDLKDPNDLAEAMKSFGYLEDWQDAGDLPDDVGGYLICVPETVYCIYCHNEFETTDEEEAQ